MPWLQHCYKGTRRFCTIHRGILYTVYTRGTMGMCVGTSTTSHVPTLITDVLRYVPQRTRYIIIIFIIGIIIARLRQRRYTACRRRHRLYYRL